MVTKQEFRDQLSSAAMAMGHSAEDLGAEVETLRSTVTIGNPWGDDEAGAWSSTSV